MEENKIQIFQTDDGKVELEVMLEQETVWLTQEQMAKLFDVQKAAVSKHPKNIHVSEELSRKATVSKMETVQQGGSRKVTRPAFEQLHLWIADNLAKPDIPVERMAEKISMSPRNFSRVYKQATGRTPAKAVEILRLEAARRLLEDSERNLNQIALQCGFGDEERMRVTFQRNLGVSPGEYRKRFSK